MKYDKVQVSKPKSIVNVAVINVPLYQLFSYTTVEPIPPGTRVLVEFGNKPVIGFVWDNTNSTYLVGVVDVNRLKPILTIFPEQLSHESIELINFSAAYYHYPIGLTISSAIPSLWRQAKATSYTQNSHVASNLEEQSVEAYANTSKDIILNTEQQLVVDACINKSGQFYPCLLHGITGSGKTEVYLEIIAHIVSKGLQALVLVPEINLTPQLLERFLHRFGITNKNAMGVKVLTSNTSAKQRLVAYIDASIGRAKIIIGTRLAVFTPFKNLGVIIVDEEQDGSFKQNDSLRYHARDLAVWLANNRQIPVVLGSATPSLESMYNCKIGKYALYRLSNRAHGNAVLPHIKLIDTKMYPLHLGLTQPVITEITQRLTQQELTLVFINRRGYAPIVRCYACSHIMACKNCSTNLVYHQTTSTLICHHCSYQSKLPQMCPKCNSHDMRTIGHGTQKIDEVLAHQFPQARIYRIDQDTLNTKTAWINLYHKIKNNEVDILVGTQILVKGHDFHNLTLVVGLDIDAGLYSYDFRASEFLYTQLTQVAGRAGRGDKPGMVLLQTAYPKHQLYQFLLNHDFNGYVDYLLALRQNLNLPPYSSYAVLHANGKQLARVMQYLQAVHNYAATILPKSVYLYQPVIAILQKLQNKERGQMLIYSNSRKDLHQFLFNLTLTLTTVLKPRFGISWHLDIDAYQW